MDFFQLSAKRDFDAEHGRNHRGSQQAPDHNDPPIKRIKFYLDKYKIKEALQVFFHNNTLKLLSEEPDFMWDVVPMICSRLRGLCQYRFRVFEGCERMLCRIAVEEHCNPKEVLISLLAEINQSEHLEDDNVFRAMIRPLEGTLLRMNLPSPREENFRWTLDVLMRHISDIELPQEYNIEGKKRLSLPNDPSVKRFIEVLPLMLSFIEELNDRPVHYDKSQMPVLTERQIDEVLNGELIDDDGDFMCDNNVPNRCDITNASITALLHLILRPFTYLDTTVYCKELRSTAIRCLSLLVRLLPDLFAPIYKQSFTSSSKSITGPSLRSVEMMLVEPISSYISSSSNNRFSIRESSNNDAMLTLATCVYLFRCEIKSINMPLLQQSTSTSSTNPPIPQLLPSQQATQQLLASTSMIDIVQSFPQVFTHESLLHCHVPYVVVMLKRPEILAHEKGLMLLDNLVGLTEPNSLDKRFLRLSKDSTLMEQLFQIMVFSPLHTNRRRAYELFITICDHLTFDCKLEMFKWTLQRKDLRPCIRAACIDQYRKHLNNIHKELMKLHQHLSFVTTLSASSMGISATTASTSSSQQSTIESVTSQTKENNNNAINTVNSSLQNNEGDSGQALNVINDNTSPTVPESLEISPLANSLSPKFDEQANIWLLSSEIMRQINLWQSRYRLIGGQALVDFLDLCIGACLPESQHTDIIETYELLLATLTMFRYLRLRKTLVKDDTEHEYLGAKDLKKNFFDPVRNAIAMVMNELKSHHRDYTEKLNSSTEKSIEQQDEIECLNYVLCRLDLVESVLVRTCDLYGC